MAFKEFKTEKVLLAAIFVLVLTFVVNTLSTGTVGTQVSSAEETSGGGDDSKSSDDNDEQSIQDEKSANTDEVSAPSVPSQTRTRTQTQTQLQTQEQSVQSTDEPSIEEVSETGEISEVGETSEPSAPSEPSVTSVEGYDRVVSTEGNVAVVEKDEKLFFLVPVTTETQVTLDSQGNVVDTQQSFFNWLKSLFSF